jgi:hypothetical protein
MLSWVGSRWVLVLNAAVVCRESLGSRCLWLGVVVVVVRVVVTVCSCSFQSAACCDISVEWLCVA